MSINNDVEIKVALDTSEAVQAVDQLATKMPKSLEKMIKRFQKIDRLIDKAWNSKDKSQNMIRSFQEVGSAFKEMTQDIEKDTKKISNSMNKLKSKDAYKGLSEETKKAGQNIAKFQRGVLRMNQSLMDVFSDVNANSFINDKKTKDSLQMLLKKQYKDE